MKFAKATGLGNDFILVAAPDVPADAAPWARRLCDRHFGIGGDGVLVYAPIDGGVSMRLINPDGTDAEISANGVRCLAAFAVAKGLAPSRHEVDATGRRPVEVEKVAANRFRVRTDLGAPRLRSEQIPMALPEPRETVVGHPVEAGGERLAVTGVSFANPHGVVFCDEVIDDDRLRLLGPALENHEIFPERANIEFVTVLSRSRVRMRIWERGVGVTLASGTGSAASATAAILGGFTDRTVTVDCDGGSIECAWPEGGSLVQKGEVELLFEGDWLN